MKQLLGRRLPMINTNFFSSFEKGGFMGIWPLVQARTRAKIPPLPPFSKGGVLAVIMALFAATVVHAQNFNSGSDGSDGALTVNQDTTLDVPVDGIFNF